MLSQKGKKKNRFKDLTNGGLNEPYRVKTGNCEPIICNRAKSKANVETHKTMRRRVASWGHQLVPSVAGVLPLTIVRINCLMSFICTCRRTQLASINFCLCF